MEIVKGQGINLLMDYGETRISIPGMNPKTSDKSTIYETKIGTHRLRIVITSGTCTDSMNGEQSESRVVFTLAGKTYQGCGHSLE